MTFALNRALGMCVTRLFSLQLSDSAGEEDPADLKRVQQGECGEVPSSCGGDRSGAFADQSPLKGWGLGFVQQLTQV
jgi:hypothetical protein